MSKSKTLRQALDDFDTAWREFIMLVAKKFYIVRLLDWLEGMLEHTKRNT